MGRIAYSHNLAWKEQSNMATRQEQLLTILDHLSSNGGSDITGAVVVSMDGIVLASRVSNDVNTDRVGAVAATMVGVTRRVSNEIKIGSMEEAIIKADNGLFMVLPAGEQSLLAVNLRQGANLGMVRIEAREAAAAVGRTL
jgi:predicted regulator of Ras-like GTPase activity (Roadblock/LC7/MglB family)